MNYITTETKTRSGVKVLTDDIAKRGNKYIVESFEGINGKYYIVTEIISR